MLKRIVFCSVFFTIFSVNAQLYEIGILGGGSNYVGDIGREYYVFPNQLYAGGVFKYNVNKRFSLRASYTYAQIKDDDSKSTNTFRKNRGFKFTNRIHELSAEVEFNFWKFNINNPKYLQTPYILLGIAGLRHSALDDSSTTTNPTYKTTNSLAFPFGGGYKFKLARNFVMGIEVRGRYAFTDSLDFLNSTNSTESGLSKMSAGDWYFFTGVQVTYSFGRPPCYSTAF